MSDLLPPCLLKYQIVNMPAPPEGGNETDRVIGEIRVRVDGVTGVFADLISIVYPVGKSSHQVFLEPPSFLIKATGWHKTSSEHPAEDGSTEFTYRCDEDQFKNIPDFLAFGARGEMNPAYGDFEVVIREHSMQESGEASRWEHRQSSFTVKKAIVPFFLTNLVAIQESEEKKPITEVENGESFRLKWSSNGTYFEFYDNDNKKVLYKGSNQFCKIPEGITRTTTYFLSARSLDSVSLGPTYLYDSLTVTVANPDLTPKSIRKTVISESELHAPIIRDGMQVANGKVQMFGRYYKLGFNGIAAIFGKKEFNPESDGIVMVKVHPPDVPGSVSITATSGGMSMTAMAHHIRLSEKTGTPPLKQSGSVTFPVRALQRVEFNETGPDTHPNIYAGKPEGTEYNYELIWMPFGDFVPPYSVVLEQAL